MSKILRNTTLRVAALPLIGMAGTVAMLLQPSAHAAFCGGLPGVVL